MRHDQPIDRIGMVRPPVQPSNGQSGGGARGVMVSGGARGVMVIVVGNGHGDTSSNPGRDSLHFT